jgi:hypothetical protein
MSGDTLDRQRPGGHRQLACAVSAGGACQLAAAGRAGRAAQADAGRGRQPSPKQKLTPSELVIASHTPAQFAVDPTDHGSHQRTYPWLVFREN